MPFDNPYIPTSDAAKWWDSQPPPPVAEASKPDRMNGHLAGTEPTVTRTLLPLSDTTVLMALRDILRNSPGQWLRHNLGNTVEACAIGWMMNFTEPTNRMVEMSSQSRRILNRLYRALPKYARHGKCMLKDISAYNDRSSNQTLDRWLTRAIAEA